MGTRSITQIYDQDQLMCTIYRQFDGYLSGHGKDIQDSLGSREFVNGIPFSTDGEQKYVNGMGCLAALLISHIKNNKAGNLYLKVPDPHTRESWIYTLRGDSFQPELGVHLTVYAYAKVIYEGPLSAFDAEKVQSELDYDEDDE